MGLIAAFLLAVGLSVSAIISTGAWDPTEIRGYHFHTYFFQRNTQSTYAAQKFREQIQAQIDGGNLFGCRLNRFNTGPVGPHPIGSYETCCNASSPSHAASWFMQNRGDLSVLMHPLTRWEMEDHTGRAMWLGKSLPLDTSVLVEDLGNDIDKCLPLSLPNSVRRAD